MSLSASESTPQPLQEKKFENLSVYWVGHSLMEAKTDSSFGHGSMMDIFESFVRSRGIGYRKGDHTLWGAPLSLQWSGVAHSNKREVPRQKTLREKFELNASRYDALILTETVPISNALKHDFSAYYLRQFYCTFISANPGGAIYLYESWRGIQYLPDFPDGDRIKTRKQWASEMVEDRQLWNTLASNAASGKVKKPGIVSRLLDLVDMGHSVECAGDTPIRIIPVGSALVRLEEELNSPASPFHFKLPDGARLELTDLFSNPYRHWPADDDANDSRASGNRELIDPERNWDEIHASAIGMYFAALVTYATVLGETPVGLSPMEEIGPEASRSLQEIAWLVVSSDSLTGVH
jgi:hypothetical protein